MPPEAHALLGASSAHRWLACTRSARMEENMPKEDNAYTEEGHEAHEYAEVEVEYRLGRINNRSYAGRMKKHRASKWWGTEMEEAVGSYAQLIADTAAELDAEGLAPVVELEQRVDYSEFVPGGFGTADAVILSEGRLHVIDLKYGKGVPVSAQDNPQLRLYALGAALKYRIIYDFEDVAMTIVQPRLGSVSTDVVPLADLMDWAEDVVEPRAREAWDGRGDFCPGDVQCRFCRVRGTCHARAEAMMEVAKAEFGMADLDRFDGIAAMADPASKPDPELLNVDETAALLAVLPAIERWAKDVQEHALAQARDHGARYPGWKLVEGRSSRKISDPKAAAKELRAMGHTAGDYYREPELKTITALEKMLGRTAFNDALGNLVIKPQGKPALVPEADKRPEIGSAESAKDDFADEVSA